MNARYYFMQLTCAERLTLVSFTQLTCAEPSPPQRIRENQIL